MFSVKYTTKDGEHWVETFNNLLDAQDFLAIAEADDRVASTALAVPPTPAKTGLPKWVWVVGVAGVVGASWYFLFRKKGK